MKANFFVLTLIDNARKVVGSDYQVAKLIHVSRQTISNWRHGHKPCPIADQTLLASIAGLDAHAWAARAIVCQHSGTEKGDMLYRILAKSMDVTAIEPTSNPDTAKNGLEPPKTRASYRKQCVIRMGHDRRRHHRGNERRATRS